VFHNYTNSSATRPYMDISKIVTIDSTPEGGDLYFYCAIEGVVQQELQPRRMPQANAPPHFTAQETGSGLQAARSRLEERVAQAREQLADASTAIANGVSKTRDVSEAYMRDRPWTILGAALIVGAVAGTLLARKG